MLPVSTGSTIPCVDHSDLSRRGHENLIEFWRQCPCWGKRGEVRETGSLLIFSAGSPDSPSYCGAFRLALDVPPGDFLDQVDDFFLPGGRAYSIRVRDSGEDDDLVAACRDRGMIAFGEGEPEMAICARLDDGPLPQGLEVRLVETVAGVEDLSTVSQVAYAADGVSPRRSRRSSTGRGLAERVRVASVVGYLGVRPVVAAQTLVSHGIGGVYWVGAVDDVRGRGMGAAITRIATNMCFDRGADAATLQASPMGEGIYQRMGYETLYRYRSYLRVRRPSRAPLAG